MKELYFKVADTYFKVVIPAEWNEGRLLPSFVGFYYPTVPDEEPIFTAWINTGDMPSSEEEREVIGTSYNDLGHLRLLRGKSSYQAEMHYGNEGFMHWWISDKGFSCIHARLCTSDPHLDIALSSVLRIGFSQGILRRNGISIHSSCVWKDGLAYLFLGKSGTGKSTHSRLWMKYLDEVQLLNDDNPALRIMDGKVCVYGTPWSGKTPCYKPLSFPVAALVRLEQAPDNRFRMLESIEAFAALLPSCSVVQSDRQLQDLLYDTLAEVCESVKVGWMECLPDEEAALLCHKSLTEG